ncbi:ATP-binding protein [Chryseobacterium gotjawalense]|uniref:ATP-binding protein n=1 Tax=Chryseobacterium gotjawalense TaxID=3042315 RepID=A0ABY8REL1_9FLAO|nr:ATP-binding protein [Chryseobacterium sp. wdc7]WHF52408.1 ATP-binding protein [Chryseobacterium sp. wdc7]
MEINFTGKFKSITSFNWTEIPDFVIITGPNGTGKSQLLDLIHNTIINKQGTSERVSISGKSIQPNEVTFLKGEWQLQNTSHVNLSTIQQQLDSYYNNFKSGNYNHNHEHQIKMYWACQEIVRKTGKQFNTVTKEEFNKYFPEILLEQESQLSQKIAEVFYNYRLSEIELKAKGISEEEILKTVGEKPWVVLREIIKESKLPFDINDPSNNGFRDDFQLKLTHQILNEEINFNDLSSGEKVLIALVFYLYNSQEKQVFPKLLLLDEPDAHLHPSMSQQFLNVIKNVLVDKFGVQVIMTTHSPSTVMLAPNESIYEMSRVEPRIKKSPSKNHSVSLLTAGLVYVGEGTKYFLVEDNDDVLFYSFVYNQLTIENQINADIPLVFIPASTKDKSGGKDIVQNWVNKLQDSGLVNIVQGLIDADSGNAVSEGIYKIDRYSIENYLVDPILVYAALIDKERNPSIQDLKLNIGEEYKLKSLPADTLQKVADTIISLVEPELKNYFPDFDHTKETEKVEVSFINGTKLLYPKWLFTRRGKTILNEVYNKIFTSPIINFSTLFKAMRKLNMFPKDLMDKLTEMKTGANSGLA